MDIEGQVRIPSGCAIAALISREGKRINGEKIIRAMKPMKNFLFISLLGNVEGTASLPSVVKRLQRYEKDKSWRLKEESFSPPLFFFNFQLQTFNFQRSKC